ncbi:MAG: HD domain-containing protein [Myxococcota bacterium]
MTLSRIGSTDHKALLQHCVCLQRPFVLSAAAQQLVQTIAQAKGRPVAVGGCVRDHLLGLKAKDVDIEVYALPLERLKEILQTVAQINEVGKSFGILKVTLQGETFDVSLPRTESKTGQGHRSFAVSINADLPFAQACLRRDFTINAMGIDLLTGKLLDPCGGRHHLAEAMLHHVSDAFDEDPLRVLRACQFIARFNLRMHPQTVTKCRSLQAELPSLSVERIRTEIEKLLLAPHPSKGLQALDTCGALLLFPELAALQNCPQDPQWHPEGDVWVHTLMVTDAAAMLIKKHQLERKTAWIVALASLCHDLGKPPTTKHEDGRIRSRGHDVAGQEPTRSFLNRLGITGDTANTVVALVIDHLRPAQLYTQRHCVSDAAIRRLSSRVNIEQLCLVAEADHLGRTTPEALSGQPDPASAWLLQQATRLQVNQSPPTPLLLGRHLIKLGHKPGPNLGKLLKQAYQAQLDGEFHTLDEALKWISSPSLKPHS